MKKTVSFKIDEKLYFILLQKSDFLGVSISEYCRLRLFSDEDEKKTLQ